MNLQSSFQRLKWRMTNGKFEPNENDIEALRFIAEWVNREKEKRINGNRYFGKIVAWGYLNLLRHYRDKKITEKEICEVMEKDLAYHYELLRMEIESQNLLESFEVLGITDPYKSENWKVDLGCETMSQNEVLENIKNKHSENKQLISENEELLIQALKPLEFKYVCDNMNFFISELLNRYGNKP